MVRKGFDVFFFVDTIFFFSFFLFSFFVLMKCIIVCTSTSTEWGEVEVKEQLRVVFANTRDEEDGLRKVVLGKVAMWHQALVGDRGYVEFLKGNPQIMFELLNC